MDEELKKLIEERQKCVADARAILDTADTEKRSLTAEETQQSEKLLDRAAEIKKELEIRKKTLDNETELASLNESAGRQGELEIATGAQNTSGEQQVEQRSLELAGSVLGDLRNIALTGPLATPGYLTEFRSFLVNGEKAVMHNDEIRALQKDSGVAGGFLSAPMQFMAELLKGLDNDVFMRQISRVLPPVTAADSLGFPSLDTDPADPDWTSEISTGSEDSSMAFGKRELKPHPLAKRIKVSKTLVRRSSIGIDALIRERFNYKMGVVQENAFLNGSGAMQPLGIFVASANGITTGRDVSTGNTATSIAFDGLKEAKYSLKAGYRRRANWVFHRDGVKQISKLKDDAGDYIWEASVQIDDPDRILGIPVRESEYAPNTFTANQYVGMLGDFSNYWIVDALTVMIQVLLELYAESNQNGYICRLECDGMPVLEEAFARVKLAAS